MYHTKEEKWDIEATSGIIEACMMVPLEIIINMKNDALSDLRSRV